MPGWGKETGLFQEHNTPRAMQASSITGRRRETEQIGHRLDRRARVTRDVHLPHDLHAALKPPFWTVVDRCRPFWTQHRQKCSNQSEIELRSTYQSVRCEGSEKKNPVKMMSKSL